MIRKLNEIRIASKFNKLSKRIAKTDSIFDKAELNKLKENAEIAVFTNKISINFYNKLFV